MRKKFEAEMKAKQHKEERERAELMQCTFYP
jgi:hypothetical protein